MTFARRSKREYGYVVTYLELHNSLLKHISSSPPSLIIKVFRPADDPFLKQSRKQLTKVGSSIGLDEVLRPHSPALSFPISSFLASLPPFSPAALFLAIFSLKGSPQQNTSTQINNVFTIQSGVVERDYVHYSRPFPFVPPLWVNYVYFFKKISKQISFINWSPCLNYLKKRLSVRRPLPASFDNSPFPSPSHGQ